MIVAVIPALDEEGGVGDVVRGVRDRVDRVVVVDNGSRDRTSDVAREAGADVVVEPRRGYGSARLAGIRRAKELGADIVLFLDADGSDDPADVPRVLEPLLRDRADLSLGIRTAARMEPGAMAPVQRFGNWLAPALMRVAVGARFRDMTPFAAARIRTLDALDLQDIGHGHPIELLLKAHAQRVVFAEVDVRCRARRAGQSKISGTIRGTLRASGKILLTIARHAFATRATRATRRTRRDAHSRVRTHDADG